LEMKLSQKDKAFLERLKELVEKDALWIECRPENPGYFVLRGNYGDKVEECFKLTRQGVRWRFWRLFNEIYLPAYETVLFIEKSLGPQLRSDALKIAHDRFVLRQKALSGEQFKEANCYWGKDKDRD
jgi:hypothetical protein